MEEHQALRYKPNDDDQEEEEEFYEKIEAPKFVDFTVPEQPLPDDRFWFCLRVGCNQTHEEDRDPDALHKSFILRVIAARSPNLKLQKALSRHASRSTTKCPQSVPPKSSKSRISKLTAIALASQTMGDNKLKTVHPICRLRSASNVEAMQTTVAAKALTTPRHKKRLQGQDPFRSAKNPKTAVSLTKNGVVSKALIFHTPKKNERVKNSLTELRAEMKKLDRTSRQKQGRSRIVSSRYNTCNTNSKVPTADRLGAHLSANKFKKQDKVTFVSQGSKDGQAVKSSKCLNTKTKANNQTPMPQEPIDDTSDTETDRKSGDGSSEVCSVSGTSRNTEENGNDKHLIIAKESENLVATPTQDETTLIEENPLASSSYVAALLSNMEETLKEKCPKIQTSKAGDAVHEQKGADDEDVGSRDGSSEVCSVSGSFRNTEEHDHEKHLIIPKDSEILVATPTQEKTTLIENSLASPSHITSLLSNLEETSKDKCPKIQTSKVGNSNQERRGKHDEDVGLDYKDKKELGNYIPKCQNANGAGVENYIIESDDKENASVSSDNRENKVNNSHSKSKILSKHKAHDKSLKLIQEPGIRDCSASAAIAAQKYKKIKPTNPKPFRLRTDERGILKEANLDRRLDLLEPSKENAEVKRLPTGSLHRRHVRQNRPTEKSHGDNQTDSQKRVQKPQLKNKNIKTSKCATETKVPTIGQQQKLEDAKERTSQKARSNSKRTKLPFLQPQRIMDRASEATTDKDTTNTISKATATDSSSTGKKHATFPKEPNLHSIHVPRNCTMKLTMGITS